MTSVHVDRALAAFAIAGMFTAAAYAGMAIGHADVTCSDGEIYGSVEDCHGRSEPIVKLSDVPWIDHMPICAVEDCSDRSGHVGVWVNKSGNTYIELGASVPAVLVIDDTATK